MAQRRMFSPDIVSSDAFLDMPVSSQLLYFHLAMGADDDGFVNPKKIMRMVGVSSDDLKVLLSKRFVLPFESGVLVIKHWLIHNLIRQDRYKPTQYTEEKKMLKVKENKAYTELATNGCQNGNQMAPQVRLGKVRSGQDRLGKVTNIIASATPPQDEEGTKKILAAFYEKVNPSLNFGNRTQREAAKFLASKFGTEEVLRIVAVLPETNRLPYAPRITTPYALREKMADLKAFLDQRKEKVESKPRIVKL